MRTRKRKKDTVMEVEADIVEGEKIWAEVEGARWYDLHTRDKYKKEV